MCDELFIYEMCLFLTGKGVAGTVTIESRTTTVMETGDIFADLLRLRSQLKLKWPRFGILYVITF